MARPDELRELLDYPNETLDVEYKSALDLSQPEQKASLARHIAALANFGGGKIVFGFEDDLTVSASIQSAAEINRDAVAGIVRRYLDPVLHCDVHFVRSSAGSDHPIIIVPSHGSAPVCAKASGPDKNGKPVGIVQGTYYLRKAGPCSEPITSQADWQPVMRRAAMHDRSALLAAIASAIEPSSQVSKLEERLSTWHAATRRAFDARLPNKLTPTDVGKHNVQFSYMIETEGEEQLPTNEFERILMELNNEVRDLVTSGWSMFYVFGRSDLSSYWENDPTSGNDEDFYQCSLVDQETYGGSADFWRVSPDGRASLIRDYWEDSPLIQSLQRQPYTRVDPLLLVRSLGEFVRHARAFAGRFSAPVRIVFLCEWHGLLGRRAQRFHGFTFGREIRTDERLSRGSWSILELNQHWERAVATLAGPLARSLGIEDTVNPETILQQSATWNNA